MVILSCIKVLKGIGSMYTGVKLVPGMTAEKNSPRLEVTAIFAVTRVAAIVV